MCIVPALLTFFFNLSVPYEILKTRNKTVFVQLIADHEVTECNALSLKTISKLKLQLKIY